MSMSLMRDHRHGGRDKESPYAIARSVKTAEGSPVPVDTVRMVGHTAALVVEGGHANHLPDRFPTVVGAADILAHTFDKGTAAVACTVPVAPAACSASAPGAR